MKVIGKMICILIFILPFMVSCTYNPFIGNNHLTGNPTAGAVGAGVGAGAIWAAGGGKPWIAIGGIAGGMFGYYVTTLRHDAGGIIQGGGQVYQIGKFIGIYIPSDALFEPNSAVLLPRSDLILDSLVAVLNRYPENNIIISGNTSGFYHACWEQRLSEVRAQVISAYLWNAGMSYYKPNTTIPRRLNYVGYGDYFPIASTLTNKGIRANSRIQITSYPSSYDLKLDRKNMTIHNIGSNYETVGSLNRCLANAQVPGEDCNP